MKFLKPFLKNLSQGARLEYVREFRHMSKDEVIKKTNEKNFKNLKILRINELIMKGE